MLKLLITGGGSYLGRHLVPLARERFESAYTVHSSDPLRLSNAHRLNIRDGAQVRRLVETLQPQAIIHTIGSNRGADMAAVIEEGARHVTAAAQAAGARLIHISTDVVFDGRDGPYDETASPTPLHTYGRAKATAESVVAAHPDHVIVRTSLIYGLAQMDHGTSWMATALQRGEPVTLFTDQLRNPVWVESLCRACLELVEDGYRGILNVAGSQELTRADFGLRMLDWWQIDQRETLHLSKSDGERWPLDCRLDVARAQALLETPLPGVDEVLKQAQNYVSS